MRVSKIWPSIIALCNLQFLKFNIHKNILTLHSEKLSWWPIALLLPNQCDSFFLRKTRHNGATFVFEIAAKSYFWKKWFWKQFDLSKIKFLEKICQIIFNTYKNINPTSLKLWPHCGSRWIFSVALTNIGSNFNFV